MPKVGIDLGTTNSLIAYWNNNGPAIIPNVLGSNLTPSVVSIDENNEIIVGEAARERLISHPHLTASCFKRYMGTEKKYKLGKYTFSPEELSSFVLKSLKADAEAFFGKEVEDTIISVPAYFNDKQRKATKRAAELAGFHVERLINEPTAAAVAYGLHQQKETKFMVFDLGGGTFDVSILEMFEGVMEVRSIAGDNYLGGEDFTNQLMTYYIENEELNIELMDAKEKSALYKQAEMCKRMLSESNTGAMILNINGNMKERKISRNDFENIVTSLLQRLRNPIECTLRDSSLKPDDLDAIILIGGATRMPVIKSVISKMFGRFPYNSINPDEAVALGAAIQVALKDRNELLDEIILTDVCPYTLGIGTAREIAPDKYESGYFVPIIERNTTIPVSHVESFQTIYKNQTNIHIEIYQGENRRVEGNVKIGELCINILPSSKENETIEVRFTYDINGILEVETTIVSTGLVKRVIIEQNDGSLSKKEIEERLKVLKDIKIHPRERMENKFLIAKGERLYEETLGEKREHIGMLLQRFDYILSQQNELEIKKAAKELKEKLESLDGWYDY